METVERKKGLTAGQAACFVLAACLLVLCCFQIISMSDFIVNAMYSDSQNAVLDIQSAINDRYELLAQLDAEDKRVQELQLEIDKLREELEEREKQHAIELEEARREEQQGIAKEYVIESGDTLCWIAQDMLVGVDKIADENGIPNADLIYSGNTLKIPDIKGKVHWVDWGETIYSIAAEYGTTAEAIAEYNAIRNWNLLYVGTPLRIPEE